MASVASSPFALLETRASPPGNPRASVARRLQLIPRKGREWAFPQQLFLLTEGCGGRTGEACIFSKPVADPGRPDSSLSPVLGSQAATGGTRAFSAQQGVSLLAGPTESSRKCSRSELSSVLSTKPS